MRYITNDIKQTNNGVKYYKSKLYPKVPFTEDNVYIISTIGDRLDLLAYQYYKDPELWWIIYIANDNATKGSIFITPGLQIRIPIDINPIIQEYNQLNS
jgi:hypothetical protein